MNGERVGRWMAAPAAAALLAAALVLPVPHAAAAQPRPPVQQDEFVPVDELPPDEELAAAPLVMAAYGAAWLIIFGYVWSLWRRLGRVEREIAGVARRVQDATASAAPKPRSGDEGLAAPKPRSGDEGLAAAKPRSGGGG